MKLLQKLTGTQTFVVLLALMALAALVAIVIGVVIVHIVPVALTLECKIIFGAITRAAAMRMIKSSSPRNTT